MIAETPEPHNSMMHLPWSWRYESTDDCFLIECDTLNVEVLRTLGPHTATQKKFIEQIVLAHNALTA